MIENLLKLGGRFRIPVRGQQRLAAHIGRVQTAKIKMIEVEAVHRQLIGQSDLQPLHAVCRASRARSADNARSTGT